MFGILVPFREDATGNRHLQLQQFCESLLAMFQRTSADFRILVVEQSEDARLFNRGALLNAGVHLIMKHFPEVTVVIAHDVDLIPSEELLYAYSYPCETAACHIGYNWPGRYSEFTMPNTGKPGYRAHSGSFYGGVFACSVVQFQQINGYPNKFYGWGGEDEEFGARLKFLQIPVVVPTTGVLNDLENLTIEEKLRVLKENKSKCPNKYELKAVYHSRRKATSTVGEGFQDCRFDTLSLTQQSENVVHAVISLHC